MTRKGIGVEDKMHIDFGKMMQQYEFYNQLNCAFWSYQAGGEKRDLSTGAMLKKKGLKKGAGDYMFISDHNEIIWLEFKTPTGKQSESQKDFEKMCKSTDNMHYYIVRSIKEAIKALRDHLILD